MIFSTEIIALKITHMLFQKRLVIISLIILWADIWSINILLGQGFSDASSEAGITLVHNTTGITTTRWAQVLPG